MSKVHPHESWTSTAAVRCGGVEEYTIWMKSLILGGKGCTVYDSKGQLAYRVDNYHSKSTTELFLMDSRGNLLCTLLRKRYIFKLCGGVWEGYRSSCTTSAGVESSTKSKSKLKGRRPWFQVRRPAWTLFSSSCEVVMVDVDDVDARRRRLPFRIIHNRNPKSSIVIVDARGGVLAEVKRKHSAQGVVLGQDVSTMMLHPNVDPSLIMSLLLSYTALLSSHI